MAGERALRTWRERIAGPLKGPERENLGQVPANNPETPETPSSLLVGSWQKASPKTPQALPETSTVRTGDRAPRGLRPSGLLAIVRVLDQGGDGTIPVVDWVPVDPKDKKTQWHHVTRTVRVLSDRQVREVQMLAETPWRVTMALKSTRDGWITVTDPLTNEQHEIRASDAPYAWWKATR
jgi:hypothetical protein